MNKLAKVKGGEIFAIPLFITDKPDNESFAREKFNNREKEFAFCRVIEDLSGGGILVEVFKIIGTIDQDLNGILESKRLFDPVAISGLGIYKKRWKKIHTQIDYDKTKDSNYQEISLVAGTEGNLSLWRAGKDLGKISHSDAQLYESWTVWRASQLEKRILNCIS